MASYFLQSALPHITPSTSQQSLSPAANRSSNKRSRSESPSDEQNRPPGKMQTLSIKDIGGGDDEMQGDTGNNEQRPYKRDGTYYFEDGSCVFLVEDTLFNVHRSMLSRDGSSFSTMFTLPQGSQESEGKSDANPIILTGDTPEEFRHFLWALYALPPELRIVTTPNANLPHLIDIARISNKYSFKSLETWALDAIQEYVNRKPCPLLIPLPSTTSMTSTPRTLTPITDYDPSEQLTRLIRLAQLCHHDNLMTTVISLLKRLMPSSLQYAYLAMTLADELGLRALRGAAYLEVMERATVVSKSSVDAFIQTPPAPIATLNGGNAAPAAVGASSSPAPPFIPPAEEPAPMPPLSSAQQLRVLSGYYRLTRTWESFRQTPPHFDHAPSCGATWHQHGCTQSWLEFWREKTRMQKDYDKFGSATYMHHDCRVAARRSIADLVRRVEDGLPEFFELGGE
ncbi:hypothetical protein BDQ17DRAFT_1346841 [Cyathus striatus]|nr:hypothetical protein BDQ17DRAFT_1346841 [Cyathus striatus]